MRELCAAYLAWFRYGVVKLKAHTMTISPKRVSFDDNSLCLALSDGRTLGAPLAWFPRLLHAPPKQRAAVTLSPMGPHWDALNEDLRLGSDRGARRYGGPMPVGATRSKPVNNPLPKSTPPYKINPLPSIARVLPTP